MCKSLYSTVLVLSMHSDSNPVSRRFCSIDSYLFDIFSLSLSLSTTNQPTTQNNEDTPSSLPSQKKTRSKGRKERRKKAYQTGLLHIHTYIHKSTERKWNEHKKKGRTEDKRKNKRLYCLMISPTDERRYFLFLFFQKSKWRT